MKIGLFGGAFDPVHAGHLHIAKLALQNFTLDKIYFIPLKQAVHKGQPQLSVEQRLQDLRQALQKEPKYDLLTIELEKPGKSYTVDTVKIFLKQNENKTDLNLYYIIGTDAFERFETWKKPLELLDLLSFIVIARPGHSFSKIEKMLSKNKFKKYLDKIFFIDDKGVDISSTKIREQRNDNKNKRK